MRSCNLPFNLRSEAWNLHKLAYLHMARLSAQPKESEAWDLHKLAYLHMTRLSVQPKESESWHLHKLAYLHMTRLSAQPKESEVWNLHKLAYLHIARRCICQLEPSLREVGNLGEQRPPKLPTLGSNLPTL